MRTSINVNTDTWRINSESKYKWFEYHTFSKKKMSTTNTETTRG